MTVVLEACAVRIGRAQVAVRCVCARLLLAKRRRLFLLFWEVVINLKELLVLPRAWASRESVVVFLPQGVLVSLNI